MSEKYFIYLMSNSRNTVLYIGVSHDIFNRVESHKNKNIPGFTRKYNCTKLVYFEEFLSRDEAYRREKKLKGWRRSYKDNLIDNINPDRNDLFNDLAMLLSQ